MKNNRIMRIAPFIALSAAIFWFSHQQQPPFLDLGFQWEDKLYHFIAYFIYGIAAAIAIRAAFPRFNHRFTLILLIITVMVFGASDEFHQWFVPGRSSDFADWLADVLGGIASAAAVAFADKKWLNRKNAGNQH